MKKEADQAGFKGTRRVSTAKFNIDYLLIKFEPMEEFDLKLSYI